MQASERRAPELPMSQFVPNLGDYSGFLGIHSIEATRRITNLQKTLYSHQYFGNSNRALLSDILPLTCPGFNPRSSHLAARLFLG